MKEKINNLSAFYSSTAKVEPRKYQSLIDEDDEQSNKLANK
jgi:hypothetical protein